MVVQDSQYRHISLDWARSRPPCSHSGLPRLLATMLLWTLLSGIGPAPRALQSSEPRLARLGPRSGAGITVAFSARRSAMQSGREWIAPEMVLGTPSLQARRPQLWEQETSLAIPRPVYARVPAGRGTCQAISGDHHHYATPAMAHGLHGEYHPAGRVPPPASLPSYRRSGIGPYRSTRSGPSLQPC